MYKYEIEMGARREIYPGDTPTFAKSTGFLSGPGN